MRLSNEVKRLVIADLRKYPDWIVRIECQGLGGEPATLGGYWEENFINSDYRHSVIENYLEYDEEIRKKIFAIERVFDRLQGDLKEIIRLRYLLPGNDSIVIQKQLKMSERTYFRLQYQALLCFARALGYIK